MPNNIRTLNFSDIQGQLTEKQTKLQGLLSRYPEYATQETSKALAGSSSPQQQPQQSLIGSPIDKFNTYLEAMLMQAQERSRGAKSVITGKAGELAAEETKRMSDFSGLEGMSPEQQYSVVGARMKALSPTEEGIKEQLAEEKDKLNKFMDFMTTAKTFGKEMAKQIAPPADVQEAFMRLYKAGEDYSDLADAPQLQKMLSKVSDEDIAARRAAKTKVKAKAPIADKIYTDKNMPPEIRQDIIDTLTDKEGAKTLGRESTLTDMMKMFPNVDRETLKSYMNEFYDYKSLIKEEGGTSKSLWQRTKGAWWTFWK